MSTERGNTENPDMLQAALWYSSRGIPVFPLHGVERGKCTCGKPDCEDVGKHPRTPHGFKDASAKEAQIRQWWKQWPTANIGMPTGATSGLLVVDVDPRNGGSESVRKLAEQQCPFPQTARQVTGGGGEHMFFKHPGPQVPKTLAPGIDLQGDKKYVVLAPSLHASGKHYTWAGDTGPTAIFEAVPPPDWMLQKIRKYNTGTNGKPAANGQTSQPAFSEGERNNNLTRLAGAMRAKGMAASAICAALLEENRQRCSPPLTDAEVRKIAKSISRYPATPEIKTAPVPRQAAPEQSPENAARPNFTLRPDGLFHIKYDKENRQIQPFDRIGPPIRPLARVRSFEDTGNGVLVEFTTWEGRVIRRVVPLRLLAADGREGIDTLFDAGYTPKRSKQCFEKVKEYLYETDPNNWVRITTRTGFHGACFVFPDERTISAPGAEKVLFYTEGEKPDHKYRKRGTAAEWRDQIGRLCIGNTRLVLAVSCAFAAPLLHVLKLPGAGLHFYGRSSVGKTTALLVAGSVWGGDEEVGFIESWRSTMAGLEVRANVHNCALLVLDEIGQAAAEDVGEAVYSLCNGTGKNRATKTVTARAGSRFTLFFLSSGEVSLSDFMSTAGQITRGGQEARLINLRANTEHGQGVFEQVPPSFGSAAEFANELRGRSMRCYGSAIEPYLEHVVSQMHEVEGHVAAIRDRFVRANVLPSSSGEVYRAAETFGVIAAAGELATQRGLTGWEGGEAMLAAEVCFAQWLQERGGIGARDIENGIEAVRSFILENANARFQVVQEKGDRKEPDKIMRCAGYKKKTGDSWTYYVLPKAWKDEACAGYDSREIAREMVRRGYLERSEEGRWQTMKRFYKIGCVRVYPVLPDFFEESVSEPGADHCAPGDSKPLETLETLETESVLF
jgi:uncharacterized protein (DUF927 family)